MRNSVEIELFDFTKAADFPPKNLENIPEEDPLWSYHIGRRRDKLYAETDKSTGVWNVRLAEYLYDTGAYFELFTASNRARSIAESTDDVRLLAKSLLFHVCGELAVGAAKKARGHVDLCGDLAFRSQDPYVRAVYEYLQAAYFLYSGTDSPDTLQPTIDRCKEAARLFEECGEFDQAVLARVDGANAMARTGSYIPAVKEVESAMDLATAHEAWKYTGRLLQMAASAAADQGYRIRVKEANRKAIQWCQFTGDCWGRIASIFSLGKLISYSIPSGDPTQAAQPERYLQKALEESKLHSTVLLTAQIESWISWLYNKCGIDPKLAAQRELVE
jgi:hypothetical protein